jgi:hypothetical protein
LLQRLQPDDKSFRLKFNVGRKIKAVTQNDLSHLIPVIARALRHGSAACCAVGLLIGPLHAQNAAPQRFNPPNGPDQGAKRLNFDERRALRQEIRSHGQLGSSNGLIGVPPAAPLQLSVIPPPRVVQETAQPLPATVMSDSDRQQLRMQIKEQRKAVLEGRKANSQRPIYPTPTEVDR